MYASGNYIVFTYDASGRKLEKSVYDSTDIAQRSTEYIGNIEYENDILTIVHEDEGVLRWDENSNIFGYEYFLKDHLGNTRVVVEASGTILQATDYYPFGLAQSPVSPNNDNKYLYNGKELTDSYTIDAREIELGWYDYGARYYDAQTGRFTTQDRFAEKYRRWSPYSYCNDNPLKFVDANGDSLVVSGSNSAVSTFESVSNTGMGGFYTLGKNGTGKYVLNSTGQQGTMNAEQQATYDMLNEVITNGTDVSFNAVDANDAISSSIFVGDNGRGAGVTATPGVHTIDVGDMQQFGTGGLLTSQGALGHEIKEGFEIQANGKTGNDAHFNYAIPTENSINGTTSTGATITSSGGVVTATVPVTHNGVTKTVTITFTNGNISVGGVTNNIK
jgi:RHS repeat-associated protein